MVSGLLLGATRELAAATFTWRTGAGSDFWSEATNWLSGTVPSTGSDLAFTSNTVDSLIESNNDTGSFLAPSVSFSGTTTYEIGGTQIIMGANGTISNTSGPTVIHKILTGLVATSPGFVVNNAGTLTIDAGNVTGSGTVTFTGLGTTNLLTNASTVGISLDAANVNTRVGTTSVGPVSASTSGPSLLSLGGTGIGRLSVIGNYVGSSSLTTAFNISGTALSAFDRINGNSSVSFNSQSLSLDFAGLQDLGDITKRGTSFALFTKGASGSFIGNLGGITSSGTGVYASLGPWLLENGSYRSQPFGVDSNYFYFNQETGNLVVVPEPSAVVIAGVGVALAGWRMARRRKGGKPSA